MGNANVVTLTFDNPTWLNFGNNAYQVTVHDTAHITQSIMTNGAVLVYVLLSDNTWYNVPFWAHGWTYYTHSVAGAVSVYTSPEVDTSVSHGQPPENILKLKVVLIAGTPTLGLGIRYPNVNFRDFISVSKAFGLKGDE